MYSLCRLMLMIGTLLLAQYACAKGLDVGVLSYGGTVTQQDESGSPVAVHNAHHKKQVLDGTVDVQTDLVSRVSLVTGFSESQRLTAGLVGFGGGVIGGLGGGMTGFGLTKLVCSECSLRVARASFVGGWSLGFPTAMAIGIDAYGRSVGLHGEFSATLATAILGTAASGALTILLYKSAAHGTTAPVGLVTHLLTDLVSVLVFEKTASRQAHPTKSTRVEGQVDLGLPTLAYNYNQGDHQVSLNWSGLDF